MHANILHTEWLLLMETIPTCFELHVSYDQQATASKLSPRSFAFYSRCFFGFPHNNCVYTGRGTYSQATPGLLNTCITGCHKLARNCELSRSSIPISLLTWSTWKAFCPAENAIIYLTCGCLQCDSVLRAEYESMILPAFGGEYLWVAIISI